MGEQVVDFIEVFEAMVDDDETQQWFWHSKSDNGEIISSGEGHPDFNKALRAAKGAHPNVPVFKIVDGEKVPVGVHSTDRYSEIKQMLGVPDSEPIFILRAQDELSLEALTEYMFVAEHAGLSNEWISEIQDEYDKFEAWQKENPDKVKLPD